MARKGFTIVEVLVVIAVIALLMAITTPAMRRARDQAQAVVCAANIKQLTLGLFNYDSDHETFPYALDTVGLQMPSGGYSGVGGLDRVGWWWFDHLTVYSKKTSGSDTVLACPAKRLGTSQLGRSILVSNYGINRSICKQL